MTDIARAVRAGRLRWLAPLALAVATGCTELEPGGDPFAQLRADAAAPRPDVLPGAIPGPAGPISGPAGPRPVEGFVRRGRPAVLTPDGGDGPAPVTEGEFTLNFDNADLREVVRVMLEDGLRANYIIDPEVTGTVTMRTNRPLTRDELLPTLEEILRLNDAAVIDQGGVLSVLPRQAAGLAAPLITSRTAAARGLTVSVTPLRYVRVEDLRAVLDSFAPVAGTITYDPRRNLVFSIGTAAEQQSIADVIALLDVDAMAGRSFALQPLRNAGPESVAEEMTEIFRTDGEGTGGVRFLPIERMNAVLVIAETSRLLDEAVPLLRGLDQGGIDQEQLYVYAVENRSAVEVARVLGDIFGVPVAAADRADTGLAPGLSSQTGFSSGTTTGGVDTVGTGTAVDALDAARAADVIPAPEESGSGFAPEIAAASGDVSRIAADEASNTIVAVATQDGARRVQSALRRLDVQPLQVMLEATLAEVVLNDQLEFGVRWFFESGNFGGTFSDVSSGAVGAVFPGLTAVFETADIRVALSALDAITDVRLLSSPTLMVLDNQTARLQVGDQVPVQTRSSTSVDNPDAPIVSETEYRDTGVILTIKPRVSESGLVLLDIRQEVSDVVQTADAVNPTFSQRVVQSTVSAGSGETVAIGGLIRESTSRNRTGIPVLSSVPVVGALFGATELGGERTELIVLITPTVVRDQGGARAATDELRQKLSGIYAPRVQGDPLTGPRRRSIANVLSDDTP